MCILYIVWACERVFVCFFAFLLFFPFCLSSVVSFSLSFFGVHQWCMWVDMDVLWGNCSVLCRMYERGKEVVRECLWQPGLSRAPRLGFQTVQWKRYLGHVLCHDFSGVSTNLREKKSRQTLKTCTRRVSPHWGRFQLMFPEILILGYVNFDLREGTGTSRLLGESSSPVSGFQLFICTLSMHQP